MYVAWIFISFKNNNNNDLAAELDEKILTLKEELKSLGLSDSEIEMAKTADISADDSKGSSQCTERSYDMVSAKSEGNEDEETRSKEDD